MAEMPIDSSKSQRRSSRVRKTVDTFIFSDGNTQKSKTSFPDLLVKSIWVHQHKLDANGHLLLIKSRLCPQGFCSHPNIDFDPYNIASYALVQTINIGLMFEV